jgi:glycosyltransferase involved in cell wall biosynthesis
VASANHLSIENQTPSSRPLLEEGALLKTPLRLLLPVYNAQHSLAGGVAGIMEMLPEWAERFELTIIDDGSNDDTAEATRELAARFPQVRVVRHPIRLGLVEAVQTGLDHAEADVILVGGNAYQLDPDDLRSLWRLRDREQEPAGGPDASQAREQSAQPAKLPKLKLPIASLGRQLPFQVIRRATFDAVRLDEALHAIARVDDARRAIPDASPRPKFLSRVRRFALGE